MMGHDVTPRDVAWREMTRRDVMCHRIPFIGPGEHFCRTGFRHIGTWRHNNGWGNLDWAGGTFFGAGFGNIGRSSITVGEPGPSWENFFSDLDLDIWANCYITVHGGTLIGPGELFSVLDLET